MLGTMMLTGGLLAASLVAYRRSTGASPNPPPARRDQSRGWRLPAWLKSEQRVKRARRDETAQEASEAMHLTREAGALFGLQTSALSLGLTSAGLLLSPVLTYAAIPTLIFMGAPPAQEAYERLRNEGQVTLALAETAALAVCLAGGYLWIGSLSFCLYHTGRILLTHSRIAEKSHRRAYSPPHFAHLYQDEKRVEVPVSSLRAGDRISLESGEVSPIGGVIVEGSAWLKAASLTQSPAEIWKSIGEKIAPMDVVMVGQLSVQVL